MKLRNRIISYLLLLVLYWFTTSILIELNGILKIDNIYITLGSGFALLNSIYSFFLCKWTVFYTFLYSIVIAVLSLFSAIKIADLHLFSHYDPYDILTAIISNAILSVLFWEIAYQIKMKNVT